MRARDRILRNMTPRNLVVGLVLSALVAVPLLASAQSAPCPVLYRSLRLGMLGSDVSSVQKYLAADRTIYPEGLVTGRYGVLTEAAVKRWQAANKIVASGSPATTGYGAIGPKTRAALVACKTTVRNSPTSIANPPAGGGGSSGGGGSATPPAGGGGGSLIPPANVPPAGGGGGSTVPPAGTPPTPPPVVVPPAALPNIVVIMADDMRADDLVAMPNVKRLLADEGITFTNSFVNFSWCCPSRASFLTGQAAHNNGIIGNSDGTQGGAAKFQKQDSNTLPVWLQKAGYSTSMVGKYLNGYGNGTNASNIYVPPGWSDWQGMPDALGAYNYYGFAINHNGVIESFGTGAANYQTDVLGQRAANFITGTAAGKPLFLWLTPLAPHVGGGGEDPAYPEGPAPAPRHKGTFASLALPTPPNFNEADISDKPQYLRELPQLSASDIAFITNTFRNRRESLLALDEAVAKIVASLEKAGRLDNTLIVFTSDNGWEQGEHRRTRGKQVVFEESIRVPLVVRGPGVPKGEVRSQLVNNLDLVATIVEMSRATAGRTQDGRSLTALFSNANVSWRTGLLVEGMDVGLATDDSKRFVAVRTQNYVYVDHTTGEKEFYDLANDPYQLSASQNNPAYASITSALSNTLSQLRTCSGASCWVTTPVPSTSQPTATLTQDIAQTTSDGIDAATAGYFTVSWSSTNAGSCLLQKKAPDGSVINPWASGTAGSQQAHPPMLGIHRFTMDCTGPGGTAHAQIDHSVVQKTNPLPTVSLTQDIAQTTSNGSDPATAGYFTVSWTSVNATSCTLSKLAPDNTLVNPWASGTAGSQQAHPPLFGVHRFTIDCTGPGGTAHADLYHTVIPQ